MRLDKYLKVQIDSNAAALQTMPCDAGRVMLNDKVAKAGTEVKAGDVITINFGNKDVKAEVLSVQETVRKEEAKEMFKLL